MAIPNNVTEFVLLGLTQDPEKQNVIFAVFLIFYLATLFGNFLIVLTIKTSPNLESPMYYFLSYLSFSDACFSSTTAPKLIVDSLSDTKTINFGGFMTRLFALHFFGCMEILVLIMMAYDRYMVICKPLLYTTIMNQYLHGFLVGLAWVVSFLHSSAQLFLTLSLPFYGPNVIDHYLCDVQTLMKLVCSDTHLAKLLFVSNSGAICTSSFVVLMAPYVVILYSLRSKGAEGRRKSLSICSSHILVVTLFFGTCIFIYARPKTTFSVDKLVSVFYTIATPLFNPLIYILRTAEVKNAMGKLWSQKVLPRELLARFLRWEDVYLGVF
ncbi:olfactory receptor 4C11-like [Tachyglossus aculeatus]|uniref:olfactory receptor 4C11-like n=1 Tax=Tachyglossus aculeatus TaxID=9261 RepID=UPI0018F7BE4C|nr:olfactory receptor 4C11-like [Tachyglossus aculeatus]